MEAFVKPVLKKYILEKKPLVDVEYHSDSVDVIWQANVDIGGLTYKPLVIRIQVVIQGWPQLSYVWGLPLLSLPDLIHEYCQQAGRAQDRLAEKRLTHSSELLTALLTYFENYFEPGNVGDFIVKEIRRAQAASSTAEKTSILVDIAQKSPYADATVSAIVSAVEGLNSSRGQRDVLMALLSRKDLSEAAYIDIARGSKSVALSDEKKGILIKISETCPATDNAVSALLSCVSSLNSPTMKKEILLNFLLRRGLSTRILSKTGDFAKSQISITREREEVSEAIRKYAG